MKNSSLNIGVAIAAIASLAAALGASGVALHFHNRATNAESRLKSREAMAVLAVAAPAPSVVTTPRLVNADTMDADELLARLYDFEAALAERDALIAAMMQETLYAQDNNAQRGNNAGGGRQGGFQGGMQNLAATDPQRAAEIQAQRDAFRQRMEQAMADRKNFFDRDPSTLTADMQGTYAAVRSLLEESEELGRLMMSQDLSGEDRREIGAAGRELYGRLEPLLQNVRREEIMSLGRDMGYNLVQQRQLVDYVERVYEATSSAPRIGGGGAGFGGAPGGNNQRGGGGGAGGGGGNRGGGRGN